ncbi:hypothetical protein PM082_024494 [Marasmius tenuissimus]|nr:hypothetical protein PM082_024494 [Marasmius tenuissimus]
MLIPYSGVHDSSKRAQWLSLGYSHVTNDWVQADGSPPVTGDGERLEGKTPGGVIVGSVLRISNCQNRWTVTPFNGRAEAGDVGINSIGPKHAKQQEAIEQVAGKWDRPVCFGQFKANPLPPPTVAAPPNYLLG